MLVRRNRLHIVRMRQHKLDPGILTGIGQPKTYKATFASHRQIIQVQSHQFQEKLKVKSEWNWSKILVYLPAAGEIFLDFEDFYWKWPLRKVLQQIMSANFLPNFTDFTELSIR